MAEPPDAMPSSPNKRIFFYHVIRYVPNPVRDEWVNIGILLFDPETGERRIRLIENQDKFARVRRLHAHANEALLRGWRDEMQEQFEEAVLINRVEFADGTFWQRKDWNFDEVKLTAKARDTKNLPMCRGL